MSDTAGIEVNVMADRHVEVPASRPKRHVPLRAYEAKRSVENIMQWNSYLPTDCVRTMVRLGWDYTT